MSIRNQNIIRHVIIQQATLSTLAINEHAREDLLKCNSCVRNWMVIQSCRKSSFAVAISHVRFLARVLDASDRKGGGEGNGVGGGGGWMGRVEGRILVLSAALIKQIGHRRVLGRLILASQSRQYPIYFIYSKLKQTNPSFHHFFDLSFVQPLE